MESAIVMPAQEVQQLVEKMNTVLELLATPRAKSLEFVSNEEFLDLMKISKRTAQTWRDQGLVSFSQISGKIYYNLCDIETLLMKHRHEEFRSGGSMKENSPRDNSKPIRKS